MEKDVPYIVYEGTIARFERIIKRLTIAVIITIVLLFVSNLAWLLTWNQYDYDTVTIDSNSGGQAAYMGDGASGSIKGVINAEDYSKAQTEKERQVERD